MDSMSISAINARVDQIMAIASMGATATGTTPQKAATSSFADALATAQKTPAVTAATAPTATTETLGVASAGSDPQLAARLDAWMAKHTPGSPLVGHGADFVRAGVANGIDPRFLVAVAAQESALGTAGSGKDISNPFGWGPAKPFSSWTEGIDTVAAGLAKGYLAEGRDTIAGIQAKWAPVGAANDPNGLNSNWTTGVSKFYAELGGTPGGSIRI